MAAPRKLSGESHACGDASGGAVGLRPIASYESHKQEESGNLGKSPLLSGVVSRFQSGGSGVGLGQEVAGMGVVYGSNWPQCGWAVPAMS
jgi:hypothetical protein